MKSLIEKIAQISAQKASQIDTKKTDLLKIASNYGDVEPYNLFLYWFNMFPNCIEFGKKTNFEKACNHIISHYSDEIKEIFITDKKGEEIANVVVWLYEDTLINLSNKYDEKPLVYYRVTPYEKVNKLVQEISDFKNEKTHIPRISLIHNSFGSLSTKKMKIKHPKLTIKDNYNDDFQPVHKTIINRLQKDNDKGLVLLHGKPGTGKTYYLRYLICQLRKDVIFLPPNMAASITDPGLIELLMENKNSVFVVEDAENILIDRNQTGSSAVSALLNLTDGLLSDCLNIQVICSFNTDLSELDKALIRKGRLIAKYEFKELEASKAQALSNKLGFNSKIEKPMTLTDIYNQDEDSYAPKIKKSMGYNKNN
ncbi:MAG: AAA family ATPase [Lentimicrobiaceae bacterium]|nr:AAA family ATPase [Lentimicrobiaceae bacterium]